MESVKVIFHLNEDNKVTMVYNNINNLLKVSPLAQIELLVNGAAANLAVNNDQLLELSKLNVTVSICENSLKSLDINVNEIIPTLKTVPVGVMELILKQQAGFAYIKP